MGLVGKLMAGEDTATLLPHSGISAVAPLGLSVVIVRLVPHAHKLAS
jgi:hypothetical protein